MVTLSKYDPLIQHPLVTPDPIAAAREFLGRRAIHDATVYRVDPDSIIFVDREGHARTMFLSPQPSGHWAVHQRAIGWPAAPPII